MLAAVAAALSVTTGLLPAVDPASATSCAWRLSAVRLHQELTGVQSRRAVELRALLAESGVSKSDFVPERCRSGPSRPESAGSSTGSGSADEQAGGSSSDSGSGGSAASSGAGTSAAAKFGWGQPNRVDQFNNASSAKDWSIYDGPGHAGNGRRTPDAVSISDGVLTITGDSEGSTAGMAWNPGQKYGRWEGRVKAPPSDESYNALLLLWPDAENFPVGGEVDFMEMMDHTRRKTELFLHYGADNSQVHGEVEIDATEWHNWAVEWTPSKITAFVDGEEWWSTTDTSIFPPGPMHLCIQLDWFPKGGDVQESYMYVDWVKQYPLDGSGALSTDGEGSAGSTAGDASTTITDEINNGGGSDRESSDSSDDADAGSDSAAGDSGDSSSPSDASGSSDS